MKWQSEIIIFIIFLNLATGLATAPELGFPGTTYVQPGQATNASQYESQFNATEIAKGWSFPPTIGIPVIGDIWSGFSFLVRMITYTIVGFPLFLGYLGDSFITDAAALAAWNIIKTVIVACFSVMMALYFVWFISGRDV